MNPKWYTEMLESVNGEGGIVLIQDSVKMPDNGSRWVHGMPEGSVVYLVVMDSPDGFCVHKIHKDTNNGRAVVWIMNTHQLAWRSQFYIRDCGLFENGGVVLRTQSLEEVIDWVDGRGCHLHRRALVANL